MDPRIIPPGHQAMDAQIMHDGSLSGQQFSPDQLPQLVPSSLAAMPPSDEIELMPMQQMQVDVGDTDVLQNGVFNLANYQRAKLQKDLGIPKGYSKRQPPTNSRNAPAVKRNQSPERIMSPYGTRYGGRSPILYQASKDQSGYSALSERDGPGLPNQRQPHKAKNVNQYAPRHDISQPNPFPQERLSCNVATDAFRNTPLPRQQVLQEVVKQSCSDREPQHGTVPSQGSVQIITVDDQVAPQKQHQATYHYQNGVQYLPHTSMPQYSEVQHGQPRRHLPSTQPTRTAAPFHGHQLHDCSSDTSASTIPLQSASQQQRQESQQPQDPEQLHDGARYLLRAPSNQHTTFPYEHLELSPHNSSFLQTPAVARDQYVAVQSAPHSVPNNSASDAPPQQEAQHRVPGAVTTQHQIPQAGVNNNIQNTLPYEGVQQQLSPNHVAQRQALGTSQTRHQRRTQQRSKEHVSELAPKQITEDEWIEEQIAPLKGSAPTREQLKIHRAWDRLTPAQHYFLAHAFVELSKPRPLSAKGIPRYYPTEPYVGANRIPRDYPYIPEDVWLLRSLEPSERKQEHTFLLETAQLLIANDPDQESFEIYWATLIKCCDDLREKENDWYEQHRPTSNYSDMEIYAWRSLRDQQAKEVDLRPLNPEGPSVKGFWSSLSTNSPSSSTSSASNSLESSFTNCLDSNDSQTSYSPCSSDTTQQNIMTGHTVIDLTISPLVTGAGILDSTYSELRATAGTKRKAEDPPQDNVQTASKKRVLTGSSPGSISVHNVSRKLPKATVINEESDAGASTRAAFEEYVAQQKAIKTNVPSPHQQECHPSPKTPAHGKISALEDQRPLRVPELPDIVEREISQYHFFPGFTNRWQCQHDQPDCALHKCTNKSHKCCREGYNRESVEKSIMKRLYAYNTKIIAMIKDKKLTPPMIRQSVRNGRLDRKVIDKFIQDGFLDKNYNMTGIQYPLSKTKSSGTNKKTNKNADKRAGVGPMNSNAIPLQDRNQSISTTASHVDATNAETQFLSSLTFGSSAQEPKVVSPVRVECATAYLPNAGTAVQSQVLTRDDNEEVSHGQVNDEYERDDQQETESQPEVDSEDIDSEMSDIDEDEPRADWQLGPDWADLDLDLINAMEGNVWCELDFPEFTSW